MGLKRRKGRQIENCFGRMSSRFAFDPIGMRREEGVYTQLSPRVPERQAEQPMEWEPELWHHDESCGRDFG